MIVGAQRRASGSNKPPKVDDDRKGVMTIDEMIQVAIVNRDFVQAYGIIEFMRDELDFRLSKEMLLWYGYCLFHQGEYAKAQESYEELIRSDPEDGVLHLYISMCLFYQREYAAAKEAAEKGPDCDLRRRLIFQVANALDDEDEVFRAHGQLCGTLENQLCLAAIHFMRTHYKEALEIYERVARDCPEYLAVNIYIGMCRFKLDQFEEANKAADIYLSSVSDSAVGLNLKACAYFHLFDTEVESVSEAQILQIRKFSSASYGFAEDLIDHNICVFRGGDDGFTVFPKIKNSIPEAKFNLAVLYMRESSPSEAHAVLADLKPIDFFQVFLKAAVSLAIGQLGVEVSLIEEASAHFQEIGNLEDMRDTIPGRQALSMHLFIAGNYSKALTVLATVENFLEKCDEFHYNKGMIFAVNSQWVEAEKQLLLVKSKPYKREIFYKQWLCRCYMRNKRYEKGWNLYSEETDPNHAQVLLAIIGYDGFEMGGYFWSMKAYDILAKYTDEELYKEACIMAGIGVFRNIVAGQEVTGRVEDVLATLNDYPAASEQVKLISSYLAKAGTFI
jgi:intraflagellar transport protein 56